MPFRAARDASVFALWNLIIRPPRREYSDSSLGPRKFKLHGNGITCQREDFTVTSVRGHSLKCSLFVPRGLRADDVSYPCVIYMHGNAGCRLEALPLVPILLPLGVSLCCFDFAGCGLSEGEYVSLGYFETEDLRTVVEHIRRLPSVGVVALWGRSMGAVTALLYAAKHHDLAGMVVDSPFANLPQLVQELAVSDYIPSWLLSGILSVASMVVKQKADFLMQDVSPIDCVGEAYLPCIFLCATSDTFVPPQHSERLYEAYGGEDKVMIQLVGEHNTPRRLEDMKHAVTYLCT
ncbi:Abhydrolase domain-containing protein, putative [Perkinsus marinus ATCC 50983]|uniref:Abhydrolase domain-containing protein, putative n=1 Tax=Perkinsus marinus (strain ATCC 50983 / TXsc) TaxID=423536 RepID=C5LBI0_PERM5|nr:Abhydrolase domain-containing protein, putative [Perkinsus marinus ATCC 50983]EER05801.1 Abhydrolase domain-containing protein, putative [Perkinsus marinus ATCC 50983]|eukprot:XP_002773985.1 Abhydrolase domain-containing protein, putative [Perkinsus marinus ATCC 50983]